MENISKAFIFINEPHIMGEKFDFLTTGITGQYFSPTDNSGLSSKYNMAELQRRR